MTSLEVILPTSVLEYAQSQATKRGFRDVSHFVEDLIRIDESQQTQLTEFVTKNRQALESLLLDGIDSGSAGPFTAADWERLKSKYRQQPDAQAVE